MAPEQRDGGPGTRASDVYAVASVMYECLTGQLAINRPRYERGPLLDVIERGLSTCPDERPASAGELLCLARSGCRSRRLPRGAPLLLSAGGRMAWPAVRLPRWRSMAGCAFVGCYAATAAAALSNLGVPELGRTADSPLQMTVEMGRPMLTSMTRAEFLGEHQLPRDRVDARQAGVGIDVNVIVRGRTARLELSCTLRDLTAGRRIPDTGMLAPPLGSVTSSTAACWIPVVPRLGHRYRATIRVWQAGGTGAPLATRTGDFEARTAVEDVHLRPPPRIRRYRGFSPPARFVPASGSAA